MGPARGEANYLAVRFPNLRRLLLPWLIVYDYDKTRHGHKNTVHAVTWNQNGNWLLSGSRDQMIKLFDIRFMREVASFKGHPREVCCALLRFALCALIPATDASWFRR